MEDDPFKKINDALKTRVDEVPEGWFTAEDWRASEGNSYALSTIRAKLSEAVDRGLVEQKNFRLQKVRRAYPVPHYRTIKDG